VPDNTRQWGRYVEVVLGVGGVGVDIVGTDIDGFAISGTIDKTIRHQPNIANLTFYNLHPNVEQRILGEFTDVMVNVGYKTNPRLIVQGDKLHAFSYWDKGDRCIEVTAADGDKAYRQAIVNETLAAGSTSDDEIEACLSAMQKIDKKIRGGTMQGKPGARLRGKVLVGSARNLLHWAAEDNDAHWSIQDGALHVVKSTSVLPTEAIVVTYETGLLEAPTISDKGIQVKCLLNPQISCNGVVWLDNANMRIQQTQAYVNGPKTKPHVLVRQSPDGFYKVFKLRHEFDTRGPEFTSVFECVAVGAAIPQHGTKAAPRIVP